MTVIACQVCGKKNRVPPAASGVPRCGNCHSALPWIVDAGDDAFAEVVDASAIPVLVDLWAPWCGPCRTVSPALENLAHQFAGRIKLVKVNVDQAPTVSQRFQAMSIPMMLVMNKGQVVATQVGAIPEHALRTWLERALEDVKEAAGT
jgi:thioredoxin 2